MVYLPVVAHLIINLARCELTLVSSLPSAVNTLSQTTKLTYKQHKVFQHHILVNLTLGRAGRRGLKWSAPPELFPSTQSAGCFVVPPERVPGVKTKIHRPKLSSLHHRTSIQSQTKIEPTAA